MFVIIAIAAIVVITETPVIAAIAVILVITEMFAILVIAMNAVIVLNVAPLVNVVQFTREPKKNAPLQKLSLLEIFHSTLKNAMFPI